MAPLILKGNSFDLTAEKPSLPPSASGTDYILVECNIPIKPQEAKKLREQNVFIEEYVGNETYLCRYTPTDLTTLTKNLTFVKNVVVYPAKVKISPELRDLVNREPSSKKAIGIHLHDTVVGGSQKVLDQITSITKPTTPTVQAKTELTLIVTIELKFVDQTAAIDGIRSMELEKPVSFDSNVARDIMHFDGIRAPEIVNNPLAQNIPSLDGKGQIITVADTGFDLGRGKETHPAFSGRVIGIEDVSGVNPNCNDIDGHGTHVAGCAVADGTYFDAGRKPISVKGTAPGADLYFQALGSVEGKGMGDWSRAIMLKQALAKGSFVHNNSYNLPKVDEYDQPAWEIDHTVARNPQLLVVCTAGNKGRERELVGGQALNKNGITVGASMTSRPVNIDRYDTKTGKPGKTGDMADFSSMGPALSNNRIKPDIVAPGVAILATASRDEKYQTANVPLWKPATLLRDKYGTSPNPLFRFSSGSSMAAPLVSGCLAILRQAVISYRHIAEPNASLIKALLLHGASDLRSGKYQGRDIGPAPNLTQGYGLVDMPMTLRPVLYPSETSNIWSGVIRADPNSTTIQSATTSLPVPKGTIRSSDEEPNAVNITLVYTDGEGLEVQTALMLMVEVKTADGEQMKRVSTLGKEDTTLQLRISDVRPGSRVNITVLAARFWRQQDQDFSVVWSFVKN